jgi:hypothetical protein
MALLYSRGRPSLGHQPGMRPPKCTVQDANGVEELISNILGPSVAAFRQNQHPTCPGTLGAVRRPRMAGKRRAAFWRSLGWPNLQLAPAVKAKKRRLARMQESSKHRKPQRPQRRRAPGASATVCDEAVTQSSRTYSEALQQISLTLQPSGRTKGQDRLL